MDSSSRTWMEMKYKRFINARNFKRTLDDIISPFDRPLTLIPVFNIVYFSLKYFRHGVIGFFFKNFYNVYVRNFFIPYINNKYLRAKYVLISIENKMFNISTFSFIFRCHCRSVESSTQGGRGVRKRFRDRRRREIHLKKGNEREAHEHTHTSTRREIHLKKGDEREAQHRTL